MKYTTEQLEAIAKKLKDMPPVEKTKQTHSKQEAVKILSKEITSMQKRGYTIEQIAEALRNEGLAVTTSTLKIYLQRAKAQKKPQTQTDTQTSGSYSTRQTDTSKASFIPTPDSADI